jgi:hypothetical protein
MLKYLIPITTYNDFGAFQAAQFLRYNQTIIYNLTNYNYIAIQVEAFLMFSLSQFAILLIVKRLGAPLTQAFGF